MYNIKTDNGTIKISDVVLSTIIGLSCHETPGVVGMTSKKVKDGLLTILNKENFSKGIVVNTKEEKVVIDVYIVAIYGLHLPNVAKQLIKNIIRNIKEMIGIVDIDVTIIVQKVKIE